MTAPLEHILQKVRAWVACADEDLRVASHILTLGDQCPHRVVAYHAQQCVEKYLKAYLVLHRTDFPYTHNIARLLELCLEQSAWGETLKDAEELSPFAITARYPGENESVSEAEARRAVDIAARVRDIVRQALNDEGLKAYRNNP